jgi:large subunit ribosomal protein L33
MPREIITLACENCKQRNYTLTKNKKKHQDRVTYKKFCPFCNKHTLHKETR